MSANARAGGGHVYVMVGSTGCKVGVSRSPRLRLLGVAREVGCILVLAYKTEKRLDCYLVERRAHELLSYAALGGEWFSVQVDEAIDVVRTAALGADADWSVKRDLRYGSMIAGQRLYSEAGRIFTKLPSSDAVFRWVYKGGAPPQYRGLVSKLEALPRKDWPERWRR